jgi:ABC-2 type transport system ATP-binding protein
VVVDSDVGTVQVPVEGGTMVLIDAVRVLDAKGIEPADLGLRRPSLDDVFLSLTGHMAEEARPEAPEPSRHRTGWG